MLLTLIVIIIVGLAAYWHWLQGLLSGFLSAVLAAVAACIAMTYYEPLAMMLSGGKFNDQAQGVCLMALFAVSFLLLRVLFDMLVPGNIRVHALADKIGGAVGGFFAGMFAAGIIVIGAQAMPFGPSIGGYARYALSSDRPVTVPGTGGGRSTDRKVYNELKNSNLEEGRDRLLIPVDDLVVGLVSHLSDGGALDNERPLESIHPDLMQELFGQRIGLETGAKHTASNKSSNQVRVIQVNYGLGKLKQVSAELNEIRPGDLKGDLAVPSGKELISVSVLFDKEAADEAEGGDRIVRVSPASVRIAAKVDGQYKNYFPIGTVEGNVAWLNKPDDFLFINVGKADSGANFLFEVDRAVIFQGKAAKIPKGTFIEVKRMAKIPLDAGAKLVPGTPPADEKYQPLRKEKLLAANPRPGQAVATKKPEGDEGGENAPKPTQEGPKPTPGTPATPGSTQKPTASAGGDGFKAAPLEKPLVQVSSNLPVAVSVGAPDADIDPVATTAVTGVVKGRKFTSLEINVADEGAGLKKLPEGGNAIQQLLVPAGQRMVQVKLSPKGDKWAWAEKLGDFTVFDGAKSYGPRGVLAVVNVGGTQRLLAKYESGQDVTTIAKGEGNVESVTILYLMPAAAKAKEIRYQGKAGGVPLEK